ncbi:histidine phosphatase family protein [Actinokineospora xionganensis]|uniref:Histidine phosphatase family protein n=1 Tax=Actinokineospora xionganensis TaxID=2684470 RepID=A0ABR7L691_9PSEU|nr:histidine phosphatase family protein [Actinokineospora xionganensis]MBC6448205.1 histidine phosphatase family protein [Actinokineospora xionganensis]
MSTASYRQLRFVAPAGSTEFLLIRHGESAAADPDRRFDLVGGQGDPPLAPEGEHQAERVAARLSSLGIDAIYVTTLQRTAMTAAPLARAVDLTPQVEADLREVFLGEWEGGLFRQKVAQNDPIALRMRQEQRWDAIPGGEPNEEFAKRVRGAVERLAARHPGQRIAVFTHGGVIGQLIALATGAAPFAFLGSDNGSISQIVVDGPVWHVRRFNDTAHLDHGRTVGLT